MFPPSLLHDFIYSCNQCFCMYIFKRTYFLILTSPEAIHILFIFDTLIWMATVSHMCYIWYIPNLTNKTLKYLKRYRLLNLYLIESLETEHSTRCPRTKLPHTALFNVLYLTSSCSNNTSWRKQERDLHAQQATESFGSSPTKTLLGIS